MKVFSHSRTLSLLLVSPLLVALGPLGGAGATPLTGCDDGSTAQVELDVSGRVSLPFATVGSYPGGATLTITETGGGSSTAPLEWSVAGPFAVEGDTSPLGAYEQRELTVAYTGAIDQPIAAAGVVDISLGSIHTSTQLGAAIGHADLPSNTAWHVDSYGTWLQGPLPSAPFPNLGSPLSDVLVMLPAGFSNDAGVQVTSHFHGHYATLDYTVPDQQLREQHYFSGRNAALIIPQGPYNQASGNFGQLMGAGGFQRLVTDVLTLLYRDGFITYPLIEPTTLTAHSGGYLATAAVLNQGGLPVAAVSLFDALYGELSTFESFALAGGVLRSSWTTTGYTGSNNPLLAQRLQGAGLEVSSSFEDDELLAHAITIGYSPATHNNCITDERSFARLLAASGLRRRFDAPPELRSVEPTSGGAKVVWLPDGQGVTSWDVLGSLDGDAWHVLATTSETEATVDAMPFIAVAESGAGASGGLSDRYGLAHVAEWLVVDGFDRVLEGSWRKATHPFAARIGQALGSGYAVASNEAVARGHIDLSRYAKVIWLLGDESLRDQTFSASEQSAIDDYLAGGGRLIVSGSEVGYATDPAWLSRSLAAGFVSDDAETNIAAGYEFGLAYEEDFPDALSGEAVIWRYATGGAAAVGSGHRTIVVGYPLETIADEQIAAALAELAAWLAL